MDNTVINSSDIQKAGKDPLGCKLGGKLNGLYYYYLEEGLFAGLGENGRGNDNTSVLGTTDAICNVTYVPFLQLTSRDLLKVPYDTGRFGTTVGGEDLQGLLDEPYVFRINPLVHAGQEITLISKKLYDISKPTKGTIRNSKFETKLQDYPYRSIIFYSNVFDKYQVIPHLVDTTYLKSSHGNINLNCCCPISAQGNYYLNVQGYKDKTRNSIIERYFINSSMDIPNTSSAYSNFMSTQKATNSVQHQQKLHEANMTPIMNMVNAGSIAGAGIGAITGSYQSIKNTYFAVQEQNAKKQDLITTPNSLKSAGGDLIARLGASTQTEVFAGELSITDEYKEKIGDYFAMYGYKQNKIMKINRNFLRSRYYYNYIKTIGCNLWSDGVPKKYIDEIKNVFDNGVTLWHMDRQDVEYGSYKYDNTEISITG